MPDTPRLGRTTSTHRVPTVGCDPRSFEIEDKRLLGSVLPRFRPCGASGARKCTCWSAALPATSGKPTCSMGQVRRKAGCRLIRGIVTPAELRALRQSWKREELPSPFSTMMPPCVARSRSSCGERATVAWSSARPRSSLRRSLSSHLSSRTWRWGRCLASSCASGWRVPQRLSLCLAREKSKLTCRSRSRSRSSRP